ncbi:hypothetical protein WQ53_06285 [Pseudoxanthomonas suwonensis]|uniref:Uncharacterized protein n=1 Tax=Pseudoxanthomonas suwonensis TaxID=314722 RepID=A0A0E3Z167_9GAMM|nr:hypothetical protein WQ53_06285 [Pseudoxanthomonas suwonensis]
MPVRAAIPCPGHSLASDVQVAIKQALMGECTRVRDAELAIPSFDAEPERALPVTERVLVCSEKRLEYAPLLSWFPDQPVVAERTATCASRSHPTLHHERALAIESEYATRLTLQVAILVDTQADARIAAGVAERQHAVGVRTLRSHILGHRRGGHEE